MNEPNVLNLRGLAFPASWKWTTVLLCYAVIVHLLPSVTLPFLGTGSGVRSMFMGASYFMSYFWLYSVLVGVSFRAGWRSREPIMADAALAGLLYFLLTVYLLDILDPLTPAWRYSSRVYSLYVWAVVLSYGGAATGWGLRRYLLRGSSFSS